MDRSLIVELPPIPNEKRRDEEELLGEFQKDRGRLLGAFLNAVSCGLRNWEDTKLESLPRMADFAKWVVACEPSLPWETGRFMEVYADNRKGAIEASLDADLLAPALRELLEDHSEWSGTASDLLAALEEIVDERIRNLKAWPKSASWLSRKLKRPATFLRSIGIDIQFPDQNRTATERTITIRKSVQDDDIGVTGTIDRDDDDDSDTIFPSHSGEEPFTSSGASGRRM